MPCKSHTYAFYSNLIILHECRTFNMFHMKHPDFFSKIVSEKGAGTIYRTRHKSSIITPFKRILMLPSVHYNAYPSLYNSLIIFCYILNKQEYSFSFYGLPFVLKKSPSRLFHMKQSVLFLTVPNSMFHMKHIITFRFGAYSSHIKILELQRIVSHETSRYKNIY